MTEREAGQLYPVAKAVIKPVFSFAWRFHVEGAENVPTDGAAIICPNHTSVLDSFFLPAVLPRRITFVGKAEYMDDWKTKYLFPAMGMIPIDRGGGAAARSGRAVRHLSRGDAVARRRAPQGAHGTGAAGAANGRANRSGGDRR